MMSNFLLNVNPIQYLAPKKDVSSTLQEKSDKTTIFASTHPVFTDDSCHFPLLKGLGSLLLLGLAVATIILTSPVGLYFIPIVVAGLIIALPVLKEAIKKIIFEVNLAFARFTVGKINWMHVVHEVGTAKLYLGALPLHDYDHINDFKQKNITEIVSLIESWEQNSKSFGGSSVTHKEWEEALITQTLIEAKDYNPVPLGKLLQAVEIIHTALKSGKNVYVHCKAGKGRSATAVVCTLLQHYPETLGIPLDAKIGPLEINKAIAYLKNIREQVQLNDGQKEAVMAYFDFIQNR